MTLKKWTANLALLAAVILPLSGCGDSNLFSGASDDTSKEALLDKGLKAIDQENWDLAVENLEELYAQSPEDPIVVQNLASAYVGQTGFDSLHLVDAIAEAQQNGSHSSVMYDTVTSLFADDSNAIPDLADKIANFALATSLLVPEGTDPALLPEDTRFEAGLFGAVETILVASNILDGVEVTSEALNAMSDSAIDAKITANFAANEAYLNQSLELVEMARDDLVSNFADESNDIAEDFDRFLIDIGFADDSRVTVNELSTYLKNQ